MSLDIGYAVQSGSDPHLIFKPPSTKSEVALGATNKHQTPPTPPHTNHRSASLGAISLEDALSQYFSVEEIFVGADRSTSSSSGAKTSSSVKAIAPSWASRKIAVLDSLPFVLTVQLNRFTFSHATGDTVKVRTNQCTVQYSTAPHLLALYEYQEEGI